MTDVLHDTTETAERPFLIREFAAEVTVAEGRTVDVRIVPYGEQIEHNDGMGGVPKGVPYREEFSPGAFDHQLAAANRVLANVEHEQGLRGIIGHGIELMERKDGLHGSFKIHETPDGDKALILIRDGVFDGVSLEASVRKSVRTAAGVVRRVKADLRGMAFTRFGAYPSARVLAIREEPETSFDELLPVAIDPELIERCRRLGIRLPQRLQAPPDDTDTSADADTSEDGTRQAENTPTSEEQE